MSSILCENHRDSVSRLGPPSARITGFDPNPPLASGRSSEFERRCPITHLTKRPHSIPKVPHNFALRLKWRSLSSTSDVERSVEEDFRYFETHRDPRTQNLGKERERIAFVIGDIIGKGRSF